MSTEVVVGLIALLGVIISVALNLFINRHQHKIALMKMHSEFSGQLYAKRLDAYLEIYELVSGFVKTIKRKGISGKDLNDFYEKYSMLDSQFGLLFLNTINTSHALMSEIKKILKSEKTSDNLSEDIKTNLIRKLGGVELSMKYELGVFMYKNPARILKKFELPDRYRDALANINGDDKAGSVG